MTPLQALQHHQQLCDALHELALEENRFLQQHQRAPEAALLERKRKLLAQLDESLEAIRAVPRDGDGSPALRQALDKARARILQILQLDKENEQLLLRYSLGAARPAGAAAHAVPTGLLQKIYQRHS
jgi:hypothetical protein